MTSRTDIWNALFSTLEAAKPPFVTVSRRFIFWNQLSREQCPALCIVQDQETHDRMTAAPDKRTLSGRLIVYTYVEQADESPTSVPADAMNAALDAIEAALAPAPWPNVQTLGGKVTHCWIDGDILMETGDTDGFGVAVVPIKILVP